MLLSNQQVDSFRQSIWHFYRDHGRSFAWRTMHDPYRVVVSEIMLQQTQTYRVEPKFEQFMVTFPSFDILAQADLRDILFVWQGLGYNRRAKALGEIAKRVMQEYNGQLPSEVQQLQAFPGIGYATASSICAFAFNIPTIFIETNIRAVFIHTFFSKIDDAISDAMILPLVEQTLDRENPRAWYYALMDYGVHLKKIHNNPAKKSAAYTKQSRFQGSDRQIRGGIIKYLTIHGPTKRAFLAQSVAQYCDEQVRIDRIIDQLIAEGMLCLNAINRVMIFQDI